MPPINQVITPTGQRITPRDFKPLEKVNTTELYAEMLDGVKAAAAKSAASRRAFLTAPYEGTTK